MQLVELIYQLFSCQITNFFRLLSKIKPSLIIQRGFNFLTNLTRFQASSIRWQPRSSSCLKKNFFFQKIFWWRWQESNLRPPECKSGALPTELHPHKIGCGGRIWTCDLWVMSPTSYLAAPPRDKLIVGLGRFELPTSRLSGVRSNQLSYRPRTNYQSTLYAKN